MSRPKSEATIQRERDRSIRAERREQRRFVRETRQALRLKRQLTHESVVKNGIPKVRSGNQYFGLRDAIAVNEIMFCESCDRVVREREMIGDVCAECYFGKEVMDSENPRLKVQGDSAPHSRGERGLKPKTLAGPFQMTLAI